MNKTVFITGATSGIGKSCAFKFAQNNYNLCITGRREERLKQLKSQLEKDYNVKVTILVFDVRERMAVKNTIDKIKDQTIDVLINNAGLAAGMDQIQDGSIDDWDQMIDTNVKGLLYVTRSISPMMVEQKSGHIINIGSIAGKEVYPKGNVYCASKHAVNTLTEAMRIDLLEHGIRVSQIAPGAVKTEFSMVRFKDDLQTADSVYKGFKPLRPEDIADIAFYITTLPPHINVNDILVMPTAQASATQLIRK
ncbi:MAG: SDR family NAD(P)-dependent oxidoreductase [Bacteroidetes bacterium]|nr:SDR family NAD(P)-dependent oxidoreductase [Bacteroidota bacterium]